MTLFGHDTWSGKMSLEPSAPTEERTSQRCLKKQSVSQSRKPPLFLCLKKDGRQQDAATTKWEDGLLRGEFTMRSFGEFPREENVSLLSQILEVSPHPRFSLSARACTGILNRAERRGKQLPPELKAALEAQSASRNEQENLGGKGVLIQPERTGALSTLNNQAVMAVDCRNAREQEVNGTLQAKSSGGVSYNLNNVIRTYDSFE